MINTYIAQYKQANTFTETQDSLNSINYVANDALTGIYNILKQFINYISTKHKIPGLNNDDMHAIAIEQIYDCLNPRKLKRGTGTKVVLDENDCELKNLNSLKNAIKYRFIREKRKYESNIVYSYNVDILDKNDKMYTDREGLPLDIGINFVHGVAYLYSGNKRLSPALNLPVVKNKRTVKSSTYADPIDCSVSLDFTIETNDDDNCEIRDSIEFEYNKSLPDNLECTLFKNEVLAKLKEFESKQDEISKKILLQKRLQTIEQLLKYSTNTRSLQQFVADNKKEVENVKSDLSKVFKALRLL